jgi:microcystin-dependent protein
MALTIGYDASGLDGKLRNVIDAIVASIQTWAGGVDGINAAQRLHELTTGIASLPTVPTGTIFMWATNTAPNGYVLCQGQTLSRSAYANLFTLWGTTWGAGDGINTFGIPDFRQRFPLGKAASGTGSTLGSTGGAIDHTHGSGSYAVPAHDHGGLTGSENGEREVQDGGGPPYDQPGLDHEHPISQQAAASVTGSSGSNNPPYVVVNYIAKT